MNEIAGRVIVIVFQMIVAGYILAVSQYGQDTGRQATPGNTPIRRKSNSQTQVQYNPFLKGALLPYLYHFLQMQNES